MNLKNINIDKILIGHSVHRDTPIPHEYNEELDVLPIYELKDLDYSKLKVFSLNMKTKKIELTSVKSILKHEFNGQWIQNLQGNGMVITTPNHSVYNENYETFYPYENETLRILTVNIPNKLIENKKKSYNWDIYFINLNLLSKNDRKVIKIDSKYSSNDAWDIECIDNHNFIGGQRELFVLHNTNNS
jgi:hypothetical protein